MVHYLTSLWLDAPLNASDIFVLTHYSTTLLCLWLHFGIYGCYMLDLCPLFLFTSLYFCLSFHIINVRPLARNTLLPPLFTRCCIYWRVEVGLGLYSSLFSERAAKGGLSEVPNSCLLDLVPRKVFKLTKV